MVDKKPEPKKETNKWKGFAIVMTIFSIALLIGLGALTYNVMYNTDTNENLMLETLNSIKLIATEDQFAVSVNTEEFGIFFVEFTKEYIVSDDLTYVVYNRK